MFYLSQIRNREKDKKMGIHNDKNRETVVKYRLNKVDERKYVWWGIKQKGLVTGMREFVGKRGWKTVLFSFILAVLTFFIARFSAVASADHFLMDKMFQSSATADMPIHIIAIDEDTLAELGQYTDWGRGVYAELMDKLCTDESSPAVVAFDILFTSNKDPEGDLAFAQACKRAGNVVACTTLEFKEIIVEKDGKKDIDGSNVEYVVYPYDELLPYVKLGFANSEEDPSDNYMRTLMTTLDVGNGEMMDSFGLAVYRAYNESQGIETEDYSLWEHNKYRFTYSGAPGGYNHVSMIKVLNGTQDVSEFDGEIVLVGAYATGFQDNVYAPSARGEKMYGVESHANIIEALAEKKIQFDVDKLLLGILYAVISFAVAYLVAGIPLLWGGVTVAGAVVLQVVACIVLYRNGHYMTLLPLPVMLLLAYAYAIIMHYLSAYMDKKRISEAFKKYVAPQVVDEVAKQGNYELKLGGQKKDIAVLFVDIRGFTPMSESLEPEQVVEILNEYLALTTGAIFKNGGTLDKFIGDATMAVFNSPFDLDDYVFRAVCTAWDIAAGSKQIEKMFVERFGKTVSYGIGVNCGDAVIGNIGCDFRMDYTAIGDTVNTAARLESNAKAGQILISEYVYERVKERVEVNEIGEIPLKGKSKGVMVYEVKAVDRSE